MRAFELQPQSEIPLTLQLREQIRYQIRSGLLKPGAPLPSLRDLAAGLGLNRNTVIRALATLAAEGLVEAEHGRGYFVTLEPTAPGARLRALVTTALAQGRDLGVAPEELALGLLAQSQIAGPAAPLQRLLLLVSHPGEMTPLRLTLESSLPVAVTVLLAHDPLPPGAGPYALVAGTLFHGAAAAAVAGRRPWVVLAPPALRAAWDGLAALPDSTPVAVVGRDWVEAGRIRQSLAAVAPQLQDVRLALPGPALAPALSGAQWLLCPLGLRATLEPLLPPGLRLLAEPAGPDPESLAELAALLAAPARPAPVSPWF